MNTFLKRALQYALEAGLLFLSAIYFALPPENMIEEFAMNVAATLIAIASYCTIKCFVQLVLGLIDSLKAK